MSATFFFLLPVCAFLAFLAGAWGFVAAVKRQCEKADDELAEQRDVFEAIYDVEPTITPLMKRARNRSKEEQDEN